MVPIIYIVIPCFNEEKVLPITSKLFLEKLQRLQMQGTISPKSQIMFVNDGSSDGTWEFIRKIAKENHNYSGISLSRNMGHQAALLAGLMEAKDKCDAAISIDCDGQDDINAIDQMIDKFIEGAKIVYGVRSSRKSDSFFKRFTAQSFYKFLLLLGVETVYNHADYRLVSRKVLEEFSNYKEVNLFLRGMFPLVGFKSDIVYYERHERIAGTSHYPIIKMISLAWNGITSLSVKPLHFIVSLGLLVATLSFICVIWSVVVKILGKAISGWTSAVSIISFLGGIQLVSIGVIGEYIGKIYMEVKHRPRFIVSERV